ncbi:MAG: hypothetical protein QOD42_926 [Sphingomonadales bacterium]|jgi:hypothetical protein|nr:hypothetical protein [Sphingomonadales bacterium]
MNKPGPVPGRERVAKRRAALRAQGLRLKQFWVPDVNSAEFKAEARRECEALNRFWAEHPEEWDSIQALQYWPPDDPA